MATHAQIREVDVTEFLQGVAIDRGESDTVEAEEEPVAVAENSAEASETNNESVESVSENVVAEESIPEESRVTIRLKFLNDTQKDVEASLVENIGQFKRRNFSEELGNNKNIRLIFNGQVLRDESSSLRSYGMFDKCVLHCLIHTATTSQAQTGGTHRHTHTQPQQGHGHTHNHTQHR